MFKRKPKQEKRHFRPSKVTICIGLLDIFVISCLGIIYCSKDFKTFWIPTAMTTMHHQYLAYTLYSEKEVNKVMSENYIVENQEAIDFDAIVIGDTSEKSHYSSEYERQIFTRDEGNDLYKIIRIEEAKFKGYLTVI